ncbi:MAG: hypothetical protein A2Y59_06560 [Chloroflexi bacterium RBG_13_52_14]|nr:MAG: hypothetical protein A2Y59_06560 [Chloroflexi bacterium RBG_13_52_14]
MQAFSHRRSAFFNFHFSLCNLTGLKPIEAWCIIVGILAWKSKNSISWNFFTFGIVSAFGIVAALLSLRFFRWE